MTTRTIPKYRAWNTQQKKWIHNLIIWQHPCGTVNVYELETSNYKQCLERLEAKTVQEMSLSHYTEKMDKNNNPIYEFDLLKSNDIAIGMVEYNSYCAEFVIKDLDGQLASFYEFDYKNFEVFGNIFENIDWIVQYNARNT